MNKIYIPEPTAVENQKSYLLQVRKNNRLTVAQFLDCMKPINLLLAQFPGSSARQCLTSDELKRLFYFAMPMKWRTNFINSGQSLHSTTLGTLKTYMIYQEQQTDALQRKKGKKTKRQGPNCNSNFRCSNTNQSSNSSNRNSQSSNASNANKKTKEAFKR